MDSAICRRGGRRQVGLNPSLYRTVRRGDSRRLPRSPSRLDIGLTVFGRSRVAMAGFMLALVLAEG